MAATAEQIEHAARRLFEADAKRSIDLDSAPHVWPRVKKYYVAQAKIVVAALDEKGMPF